MTVVGYISIFRGISEISWSMSSEKENMSTVYVRLWYISFEKYIGCNVNSFCDDLGTRLNREDIKEGKIYVQTHDMNPRSLANTFVSSVREIMLTTRRGVKKV